MLDSVIELSCGESATIAKASLFYSQMLSAMAEGQAIQVDLSQIERIDTSIIQLFYAFHKDAQLQNLVIIWLNPSQVFQDTVGMLGMGTFYA
ncbi:MAG TPA: STAS domain-containing protein [Methylophaga aminisulfidivorans]|uniref:STAS domain-containing protein n=2 Tax=root TaxID=1 RepID=A0A7C1ZFZ9_9GAMM|nr:STAS domain-containing protein [Methylophaga aminisulfidivorans]HEC73068.1 STAS domain-containing protein [Methylophaga aminisulfidivorans]